MDAFVMKKILVTGANGQLGSEIRFLSNGVEAEFIFTDKEELDITSSEKIQEFYQSSPFDAIINCAAYTAVDKAESDVDLAYSINASAVGHLASLALEKGLKMIHISTDYVFDGKAYRPYSTDVVPNPSSIYGKSKAQGENEMLSINPINSAIIRTSWVYSSFGHNFVKTMLRLGAEKRSLNVVSDQIGSPTYARDLASAILKILPNLSSDRCKVYHYSNEGTASWYDFALAVMEIKRLSCNINPIPTEAYPLPAPRPFYSLLEKSAIKADFDVKIPHWRESLNEALKIL
jgi:dTDP-4-dehydrorhamnose reductase